MDKQTQVTIQDHITIDHAELIKNLPVAYLAYEAVAPYRIIDENAAHEAVAMTKREEIVGRAFLEVYPDTSDEFKQTGKSAPIESIKKIVRTKQPDSLGEFKWDVLNKDGTFTTKYWRSTQYPIFDTTGKNVVAVYQLTDEVTDRKVAEKQLTLTKYHLDQTLADGLIGTWVWDMRDEKVFGGPNLAKMFGVSSQAAAEGLEIDEFTANIHSDDRIRVVGKIQEAVETRSLFEEEYRTVDSLGNIRWLIARGRVETDETGELDRFPGVVIDITDRKNAEESIKESENRLRFMADSMPQLVWITRPDGYHEYYNKQWYAYTGTKDGSTDGEGWSRLFHPDDQPRAQKLWRKSLKTGEPYEIEYRLYNASTDAYRWVIGRALPLRDDTTGEILKWYGTCTDIDEQKRSAVQQKFLADVSKALAGSIDTGRMMEKVTKLTVPVISDWCMIDLYSETEGFTKGSMAHSDPFKLERVSEFRNRVKLDIDDDTSVPRVVRTGKPELIEKVTSELIEAHIADTPTRNYLKKLELCSVMAVPLVESKKIVGVISFISAESQRHFNESDFQTAIELASRLSLSMTNAKLYSDSLTDLKRRRELERELRIEKQTLEMRVKERTVQLQLTNQGLRDEIVKRQSAEKALNVYSDELTRSNKELEDFAYVASHDLQEPLRKIQAFGNLLLSEHGDSLGPEGADYLQRMHSAANRMSTLIEDLLAFSRVSRRQKSTQPVDLNDSIHDVVGDLEVRIADTNASITIDHMPTVTADPTHMRQLFQNLIGNAIKFHRSDMPPVVMVTSKEKNGGYEISVKDNGIGFDERYLDRIFAVFQRLHERSTYEGTGIGLAVCRKIAESYGGTITATSKKDNGSTFVVWMPKDKRT